VTWNAYPSKALRLPAELRVTVGGAVIKQEPMIDYRGPAL
jgi:hypothetical protein